MQLGLENLMETMLPQTKRVVLSICMAPVQTGSSRSYALFLNLVRLCTG